MEVSTVRGRRWGSGIGSGHGGGAGALSAVCCSHRAQWGFCVRPAHGGGALERLRWACAGTGGVGRPGLDHMTYNMTQSHTRTQQERWETKRGETIALPPPKRVEMGAFYQGWRPMELSAKFGYTTDSVGWGTKHASAAWPQCLWRATATMYLSLVRVIRNLASCCDYFV